MRYFTLTYYKQPNGQYNEIAETKKNLKPKDVQGCNIILDFKEQSVIKCTVNGEGLVRDRSPDEQWETILAYYSQYHGDTFAQLIKENG